MKVILPLFIAVALAGCSQTPSISSGAASNVDEQGLVKVENSGFTAAYISPDANLKQYSKIYFSPLETDGVEVVDPEKVRGLRSKWRFTERDAEQLSKAYSDGVQQTFADNTELKLENAPASGGLEVATRLVRFAPTTPKFDSIDRTPRSKFFADSSARVTLETTLIDTDSKKVIARIKEDRDLGNEHRLREITSVRFALDLRQGFGRWARHFKTQYEQYVANL